MISELHEEAIEIIKSIIISVNGEKPLTRRQKFGLDVISKEINKLPEFRLTALLISIDERVRKVLYAEGEDDGSKTTEKQTPP